MKRAAFTLVEILIVVIILGILAAIVIPQFTEASDDARLSSLVSDLQTTRSQLELYRVQHSSYPDGADSAAWKLQLSAQTDIAGAAGTDFGPYLQIFPTNPFTNSSNVKLDTAAAGVPGTGTEAWYFNTVTGKFAPNDAAHASL